MLEHWNIGIVGFKYIIPFFHHSTIPNLYHYESFSMFLL